MMKCFSFFRIVSTILVCLLLIPFTSLVAAADVGPKVNGKIAFISDRDGNNEIYVMNPDGSDQTRLTNNNYDDGAPAWSPDGTKIASNTNRDGNHEIYTMNADGSD
jgi:dipeptidyl aminopeptidase/acylaminoacyl peptidase